MVRLLHNHLSLFYKFLKENFLKWNNDGGKGEFKSIPCLEEYPKRGRDVIKRGKNFARTLLYTYLHTQNYTLT